MSDHFTNITSDAQLIAREHALRAAQLASDVVALDGLLDETLRFIGPDGAVYNKDNDLDSHRRGLIHIAQLDASEEFVQRMGDVAVISVRMDMRGTFQGNAFVGPFRYTRIWRAFPDGWRIVAGHVSAIL